MKQETFVLPGMNKALHNDIDSVVGNLGTCCVSKITIFLKSHRNALLTPLKHITRELSTYLLSALQVGEMINFT